VRAFDALKINTDATFGSDASSEDSVDSGHPNNEQTDGGESQTSVGSETPNGEKKDGEETNTEKKDTEKIDTEISDIEEISDEEIEYVVGG
jgi:hypothetical protein